MSETLGAVSRASKRSSAVVHEVMRAGVYGLATIASLAPWVGVFGTVLTFPSAFVGPFNGTGRRERMLAFTFDHLATSLWFTAFGLAVGLLSLWFYQYLAGRLRTIDLEMENASLDLLNQLSRLPARFAIAAAIDGPMFGEKPLDELNRDDTFRRWCIFLAGIGFLSAWFSEALIYVEEYSLAVYVRVPLMFGLSFLPAYPLWAKLLRRRPGGLIALASVICLCWSVAELALGRHLP